VAARLLKLWVRIPPRAWMCVCCECCVLSGRGLCDEPIIRPEESYRLWCVVVCDLETSWMRRLWPTGGCHTKNKHATCFQEHILHFPRSHIFFNKNQLPWRTDWPTYIQNNSIYTELITYSKTPCGFKLQRYKMQQPEPFIHPSHLLRRILTYNLHVIAP
jgi:hypothetical protein